MKNIFGIILGVSIIASAALVNTVEGQASKSGTILAKVSKTYKTYKTIKANFQIEMSSKQNNRKNIQKGTLYLKGKKFKIDLGGQVIICDGKTVWTYLKSVNEVQISKYDPKELDISPSTIFTIFEKGFKHQFSGTQTISGKGYNKVELTPVDKSKPYFKVKMLIAQQSNKIKQMTVLAKNGTTSVYKITSFSPNVPMNEGFFKFNAKDFPGVHEIDLR